MSPARTQPDSLARRFGQHVCRDGLERTWQRAIRRTAEALVQTSAADWYRADLTVPLAPLPLGPGQRVDFDAFEEAVAWLNALRGQFRWVWVDQELQAARAHGHILALLRVDGQRAGYVKVGLRSAYVGDFGRCIALPEGVAFIYDTFVHPDFRGQALAARMVGQLMQRLQSAGWRALWCHIPRWNKPSIHTFRRCGFEQVRHVRHVRLLGQGFCTHNPERLLQRASPRPVTDSGSQARPDQVSVP